MQPQVIVHSLAYLTLAAGMTIYWIVSGGYWRWIAFGWTYGVTSLSLRRR